MPTVRVSAPSRLTATTDFPVQGAAVDDGIRFSPAGDRSPTEICRALPRLDQDHPIGRVGILRCGCGTAEDADSFHRARGDLLQEIEGRRTSRVEPLDACGDSDAVHVYLGIVVERERTRSSETDAGAGARRSHRAAQVEARNRFREKVGSRPTPVVAARNQSFRPPRLSRVGRASHEEFGQSDRQRVDLEANYGYLGRADDELLNNGNVTVEAHSERHGTWLDVGEREVPVLVGSGLAIRLEQSHRRPGEGSLGACLEHSSLQRRRALCCHRTGQGARHEPHRERTGDRGRVEEGSTHGSQNTNRSPLSGGTVGGARRCCVALSYEKAISSNCGSEYGRPTNEMVTGNPSDVNPAGTCMSGSRP